MKEVRLCPPIQCLDGIKVIVLVHGDRSSRILSSVRLHGSDQRKKHSQPLDEPKPVDELLPVNDNSIITVKSLKLMGPVTGFRVTLGVLHVTYNRTLQPH